MTVGKIFSMGQIVDFSGWWPNAFSKGGPTMVKFHYNNSKLRDKQFSTKKLIGKYQMLKSMGALSVA